jgi:hypothetical protein
MLPINLEHSVVDILTLEKQVFNRKVKSKGKYQVKTLLEYFGKED